MAKTTANPEDEFYDELDKKTRRRSCCSWPAMLTLFLGLLIVSGAGAVYLYSQIKSSHFRIEKIYPSNIAKTSLASKLQNQSNNPEIEIAIFSAELNSLFSRGLKSYGFEIKETQTEINDQGVLISGKLIKPLKADIEIQTVPQISDGRLRFKVTKTIAGKLVLPKFLNSEIEKATDNLLDAALAPLYENYQLSDVSLSTDQMTLKGRLKG